MRRTFLIMRSRFKRALAKRSTRRFTRNSLRDSRTSLRRCARVAREGDASTAGEAAERGARAAGRICAVPDAVTNTVKNKRRRVRTTT